MEFTQDTKQDGFSAVSERQGDDQKGKLVFAMAACVGAGGLVCTLIFGLLGHTGLLTLAVG
ncbi:MAG: hypothetical protein ACI89L_002885 [Phycisphaerales bacterium]|jgi:hypothetical protein